MSLNYFVQMNQFYCTDNLLSFVLEITTNKEIHNIIAHCLMFYFSSFLKESFLAILINN